MKKRFAIARAALLLGASFAANAALVQGEIGQVTRMRAYSDFGNGDVVLWVQNPLAGCDGFWFRTTELNGKEFFAQILASQKTQLPMFLTADDDQIWPGSAAASASSTRSTAHPVSKSSQGLPAFTRHSAWHVETDGMPGFIRYIAALTAVALTSELPPPMQW